MNDPVFMPQEQNESRRESQLNLTEQAHIENIIPGGKYSRAFGIITIVLFIGILLSFLVNFGVSAYLGTEELADSYYDDEEHPNIFLADFSNTFYLSKELQNSIIKIDYDLFGSLPTSDVILGTDEFLFPTYDEARDYNYVADYLGEYKPSGTELDAYYNGIKALTEEYKHLGTDIFFIIIPNSQTVYSDKTPDFMGKISNDTRLKSVTRYFGKRGVSNYLDLTDALISAKDQGELYNNTEDSLNSRGAYYTYLAVLERLPKEVKSQINVIELTDADLVKHATAGKSLARSASLEDKIQNRTVSLSGDFVQKYEILLRYDDYEMTFAKIQYKSELPDQPRIQLQFASDWDRILMIDYFSNTFGRTICCLSPAVSKNVIKTTDPNYVFCFIHEKDLDMLIDGSLMPQN